VIRSAPLVWLTESVIALELFWLDRVIPAISHEAAPALTDLQWTVTPENPLEVKNRTSATLMPNRTAPLVARYPADDARSTAPAGPTVAMGGPLGFAAFPMCARRGEAVWVLALEPHPAARPAAQRIPAQSVFDMKLDHAGRQPFLHP